MCVISTSNVSLEKEFLYPIRSNYEKFICSQSINIHTGLTQLSDVSSWLVCQNNQRAKRHLPFHTISTCPGASERERVRASHDSTVIGSFSSLWTHSTHPSTHLTVLKPQHLALLLLWKSGNAHTQRQRVQHTHSQLNKWGAFHSTASEGQMTVSGCQCGNTCSVMCVFSFAFLSKHTQFTTVSRIAKG